MAKVTQNAHAYGDITQGIWTSPIGTANPTAPLPTAWPSGWSELGWIDDGGVTETAGQDETKKYGWQGASIIRVLRSKFERSFKFNCLEENAVTLGLIRPGVTPSISGFTAEVQTVTISGTPTGGTFTLTVPGYGSTGALAYNVPTATLATTLSSIVGGTVAVTGTAGSSYVATFPQALGNLPQMTATSALTGGTSPSASVATTTPGVNGTVSTAVKPYTSLNLRQFGIDLVDGSVHRRFLIACGEVTNSGDIVYKSDDRTVYERTLNCYPDALGNFYTEISDNPAVAQALV